MVFALRLLATGSILIKTAVRSGPRRNRRCVIQSLLTILDPSLTLTHTQCPAIVVSKARNRKPLVYAGIAYLCNPQQPLTAHS
jgi:hypothetical protein